ncbi:MAG: hypothetical protein LUD72_11445 [Bacteroidales bacterium]|nr:hypothetical protein [Bacteroidales bacterium]
MTLWEFNLRIKAYSLHMVDREYEIHLAAWANRNVGLRKKSGKNKSKYVFQNWDDFFDYKKRIADINGVKQDRPETIADKLRQYNEEKHDG